MLLSVAEDLVAAKIPATVALCRSAMNDLSVDLPVVEANGDSAADIAAELSGAKDVTAVFPIAPECDRILTDLIRGFRNAGLKVHAPMPRAAQCFSDKWSTFRFLEEHRIPSVPTYVPSQSQCHLGQSPACVKPRDGLSCAGVQRCRSDIVQQMIAARQISDTTHIVQPFVNGTSWSIGCICREGEWLLLPTVQQSIDWNDGLPQYKGGTVYTGTSDNADQMEDLAQQVIAGISGFSGYLGIDFIVAATSQNVAVMEINPRLCSSYVGYRRATKENLMAWMLDEADTPKWCASSVHF